ncbi:HAD-IIIA family hydrolase [Streptomyces sp. NPDC050315]|uniref:D-glycero-alpha-D-manno-heptose-1,7-bisphosphate 7-phosphatase n=1 Tax=Streptomyces sp. NPDC050315 TaxID=3155039 RepID=UPI00343F44F7
MSDPRHEGTHPVGDRPGGRHERPAAVLFDRDGTLIEDVPYNSDPRLVRVLPGVPEALRLLRAAGIPTAVVSNQSGVGRGLLTENQVRLVNARVDDALGGFGTWVYCPHHPYAGCHCRKPKPGLVIEAARRLAVPAEKCVVIGDIGADVLAAQAAGARAVLVPNAVTRPEEVTAAPCTAPDVLSAVRLLLGHGPETAPVPVAETWGWDR